MKLSIKERNAIYMKALDLYIKFKVNDANVMGLCYPIHEAAIKLDIPAPNPYEYMEEYPEVFSSKPAYNYAGAYWFPIKDHDVRINILRKAIEATNEN